MIRNLALCTNVAIGRGFKSHFQLQKRWMLCPPFLFFSNLCVFLSQLCEDTADAIEDEDGEGQEGYRRELAERERGATEERAAKVDYQYLYSCDKGVCRLIQMMNM